jgi:hypothetical protein
MFFWLIFLSNEFRKQILSEYRYYSKGPTRGSGEPTEGRPPKIPVGGKTFFKSPSKARRECLKISLKTLVRGGGDFAVATEPYFCGRKNI